MTYRPGDADLSLNPSVGTHYVFMSSGVDVKTGFADHLYHSLDRRGIEAFWDRKDRPNVLDAVRRAAIQVPIFTKTFAESVGCLDVLVEMMESTKRSGKVIPVYYEVTPKELRKKDGPFAKAIQVHREKGTRDEVTYDEWGAALEAASWFEGWWLDDYKGAGELLRDVLEDIDKEINAKISQEVERDLVGLERRVDNVVELFRLEEEGNVLFLLLWGMVGIGKTTLARAIFARLGKGFQVKSFVEGCAKRADKVQHRLLNDLLEQKNFEGILGAGRERLRTGLRRKKVLIVLDDMKDFVSIREAIDLKSLHTGSLILVTSRSQSVFPRGEDLSDALKVERYEVQGMDDKDSLQLLCSRAFMKASPEKDLEVEAQRVSRACGGLPLSLRVVGDHLHVVGGRLRRTKEKKLWKDAIELLRTNWYREIDESLMSSFDALSYAEQEMFLDVACLLIDEDKRCAKYFWDGDLEPTWRTVLESLVDKSLVKVCVKKRDKDYEEYKCLTMHDQLRDFGRAIVKKEFDKSGKCSRVWHDTQVSSRVLRRMSESLRHIRGLATSPPTALNTELLSRMESLRLLFMKEGKLDGNDKDLEELGIRWLKLTRLPDVAATKISALKCLTVLELYGMEMELPLIKGQLKTLRMLVMVDGCSLSEIFGSLESLEELRATGLRLKELPPSFLQLEKLQKLSIYIKELEDLPERFGSLTNLKELEIRDSSIQKLPSSFGDLENLRKLAIIVSKDLEYLPENFGSLKNLEELNVSRSAIRELPPSFAQLRNLRKLDVSWCGCLEQLPERFGDLESLEELDVRYSGIKEVPLEQLQKLQKLDGSDLGYNREKEQTPKSTGGESSWSSLMFRKYELLTIE